MLTYADVYTGYSIDLALEHVGVLIEVDGPYHFAFNSRYPLGSSLRPHALVA